MWSNRFGSGSGCARGEGTNHVGPKRLGMRLVLMGPSLVAWALRLSVLGVSVALVLPIMAKAALPPSQTTDIPLIYHKGRNFRIPFNLSAETRGPRQGSASPGLGGSGIQLAPKSKTYPNHPTFTFRSSHDGEYWFAVQTMTLDGKFSPPLDAIVEPNMKVVVDTFPPSLMLEPDDRRGSLASVHWEVKDEHIDLKSLVLEYQVEGVGVWRRVPIRQPKLAWCSVVGRWYRRGIEGPGFGCGQSRKCDRGRDRSARGNGETVRRGRERFDRSESSVD